MGTRGLVIIRCRGRYFVYYNQFDSYPEGLGDSIVREIPKDYEEYCKWLKSMREDYGRIAQYFEEHILPVDVNSLHDDLSISELHAKSYLSVDDRLECAPLQMFSPELTHNLCIEWTYTIDLDREVFAVDDGACYKLSSIPRGGHWIEYLSQDARWRRTFHPQTPRDLIADIAWKPSIDLEWKFLGKALEIELVSLSDFVTEIIFPACSKDTAPMSNLMEDMAPAHMNFLVTAWLRTCGEYRSVLDRFVLEWEPECFMFREIAFAALSFAAGEVYFECPQVLNSNYASEGYFLTTNPKAQKSQSRLLPHFLYERHLPGVEPGSAPKSTSFWFHNVLVHLTSRLDLTEVEESSVVYTVNYGLGQGYNEFYAMVLSILDVILIHVQKGCDGKPCVKRSPLMSLFEFDDTNSAYANGPRTRPKPAKGVKNGHNGAPLSSVNPGTQNESVNEDDAIPEETEKPKKESFLTFMLMHHFFNAATDKWLAGAKSLVFPNEILSLIMDHSDIQTYHTLATVSAFCQQRSRRKLRLNDDYAVVGRGTEPAVYVLEDLHSGDKIQAELGIYEGNMFRRPKMGGLKLNPIIGVTNVNRLSIMNDVTICLENMTPKDPIFSGTMKDLCRDGYNWSHRLNEGDGALIFKIPNYAYLGAVENVWGKYLKYLLSDRNNPYSHFSIIIRSRLYPCFMPPGYRELGMEADQCSGLHLFLRHGRDETPEEWRRTLQYVASRLPVLQACSRVRIHRWGHPVIVAFSTNVKLFYYVFHRCDKPKISSNASSYTIEIAAKCTDPDPGSRLVQLIAGDEPVDLKDDEGRMKFETWIKLFGINHSLLYNPFTEEFQPPENEPKRMKDEGDDADDKS